jgi:integrase
VPRTAVQRLLSGRDIPLREKTLRRMLYETAARAAEILEIDVQDLDLDNRQAPIRSQRRRDPMGVLGHRHRPPAPALAAPARRHFSYERTAVPVRTQSVPARRPAPRHICPHTGRARLGYDRCRVLLDHYAGLELHHLRRSAATHLGDAKGPLQLIMAKTRHKNLRTAMRYVKPGGEVAKGTGILGPSRRKH